MSTPGVSTGTMIIDDPEYGCTSGLVTAITIRKSATDPLDVNHLCPLMTHSSPSRTADVFNSVGSDPAVSGSVIEKADRRSPSKSGCNHCERCDASPLISIPTASNSALPESGALLPKTTGANGDCPRISCINPKPHLPEAHPAERRRQVRRPQPLGLDLLLQRADEDPHLVVGQIQGLEREHLLADEPAHPLQLRLELGFGREIPGHDHSSQRSGQLPEAHTLPLPWAP